MDSEKQHTGACKPEVGRGCAFCDCGSESEARLCDGCFKLHETPWLDEYPVNVPTDIVEVRFKNTRRSFYQNVNKLPLKRGDIVAVEASPGHDIGIVSLTGDLVARQMRRTGFNPFNGEYRKIYRKAKPYDIEKWQEAIALEHETMIASRQIAADMGLNMKIGDVEYQGDKIKAIFYYIADERVDFRELIKVFAEQFHIRIEMKQIGARQEAGRIGGLGACGRELCCSSYLDDFHPVSINMAKDQNLSLNPAKISGVCGRLMCCLKYEHEAYAELQKVTPRQGSVVDTPEGRGKVISTQMLRGTCKVQLDDSPEHSLTEFQCTQCCMVKGACRNRQNAAAMAEERRKREDQEDAAAPAPKKDAPKKSETPHQKPQQPRPPRKPAPQQTAGDELPEDAQNELSPDGEGAPRRRRRRGGRRRRKPNGENGAPEQNSGEE